MFVYRDRRERMASGASASGRVHGAGAERDGGDDHVYSTDMIQFSDATDERAFIECNASNPESIKLNLESDPPTCEFMGTQYVGKVVPETFGRGTPPENPCSFQSSVLYEHTETLGSYRVVGIQRYIYEFGRKA